MSKEHKDQNHIIGGADTQNDLHVAAIVDAKDRFIASECFATTRQGYRLSWNGCSLLVMCSVSVLSAAGAAEATAHSLGEANDEVNNLLWYIGASNISVKVGGGVVISDPGPGP